MKIFMLFLLLLCYFNLKAQQFFFNKTTKQFYSFAYMDSVVKNLNIANTNYYPYFLKSTSRNDSNIITWVQWPNGNNLKPAHQKYIYSLLKQKQQATIFGKFLPKNYFENKIIVINFWADYCAPCIAEMPLLNTLKQQFNADTSIVFISACQSASNNCGLYAKQFNFITLQNKLGMQLINAAAIYRYPTTIIINKKGVITHYMRQSGDLNRYPIITADSYYLTLLFNLKLLR